MIDITSNFDGGNIEVVDADSPGDIRLRIRRDAHSDFMQWFYFRMTGGQGADCRLTLENAGDAAYLDGWKGYNAVASYDLESWFRVSTEYRDGTLVITHRPESDIVWYAYFAPYSMERHAELIASAANHPLTRIRSLGRTLDGQDIDMIEAAGPKTGEQRRRIWMIARQHPGETMAEWWMEGMLDRLLDLDDPVSRTLLSKARFFIVPNMNPDGSRRGHLRTNAAGVNLNRAWNEPSEDKSPEVFRVRKTMERVGVDFHLDVHGDEAIPHNFLAGFENIPSLDERQALLFERYKTALAALSPDFQTEHGYPAEPPGSSDLRKCTEWTAERFGCLAMTLEMPFKDNANLPEPTFGWSPARSKHLGRACLDALLTVIDDLR